MSIKTGQSNLILFCVLGAAFFFRVFNLDLPFFEPYNNLTRQAVSAMIARNFYHHGFNFIYPEIDQNGAGPYLFNAEMPIAPFLMALGYKLAGGAREWVARAVSVFFSMGFLVTLYFFIKRLFGREHALVALIFASFSPISMAFARSIQPDMLMLFASVAGLYFFYVYLESKRLIHYFLSAGSIALAVASKVYTLYLFIPLGALALLYQGRRAFFDIKNYLLVFFVSLTLIWYAVMWHQGQVQELYYRPLDYNRASPFAHPLELFSLKNFGVFFKIFFIHMLTPVGSLFFTVGLFVGKKTKEDTFFYSWFAAVLAFHILMWPIMIKNPYYELAFVPPAAFFLSRGFFILLKHEKMGAYLKKPLVILLLSLAVIGGIFYYYKGLYFIPDERTAVIEAGNAAQKLVPKEKLVVASLGASPTLLYYCDRKGWEFDLTGSYEDLVNKLEKLRGKGAAYFVSTKVGQLSGSPDFEKYLRDCYTVLDETESYIIFNLDQGAL